jgi:hypothetical protein
MKATLSCAVLWVLLPSIAAGRSTASPPSLPAPTGTVVTVSSEAQLQAAIQHLTSNTTIVIAPGTYVLSSTLYVNGSFSGVAIRGATDNRDDVVLVGPGMTTANYGNSPYGIWTGNGVSGILIANLTLRDFYDHCLTFNAGTQSPHVYNVHLINAGQQLLKSNPDGDGNGVNNGIVEYSVIEYTSTSRDYYTNGVDVHAGSGWVIRHNLFRNIVAPSGQLAGPAVLMWNHSRDTITEGNLFVNCARGISYGLQEIAGNDHSGGIIRNNFFFRASGQSGDVGIAVMDSPNTQVLNNTVFVSGTYSTPIEYRFPETTGTVIENNLLDGTIWARDGASGTVNHNLEGATAPLFANAASGDLHLAASATSAIDRGMSVPGVTDDWDGEQRPQGAGYDIGADERGASSVAYRISGHVTDGTTGSVMPGIAIAIGGARSQSIATDTGGAYSFTGLAAGVDYTVTPNQAKYEFSPPSSFFPTLGADQTAVDFRGFSTVTNQPPIVTVATNGSAFTAPASITCTATALDPDGTIAKVDFYASGILIGTDTGAPLIVVWNDVSAGTYSIIATATDNAGAATQSLPVSVTVSTVGANRPPSVTLATNGPTFTAPASITFTATASDPDGTIAKVDFYAGGTLIGTDSSAPFIVVWNDVSAGTYSITAAATDNGGAIQRSTAVNVTVSPSSAPPSPNRPPTITLVEPSEGAVFSWHERSTVRAIASDADGSVVSVRFYAGASLLGTDSSGPDYAATWRPQHSGTYRLTAVAIDNAGASTTSEAVVVTVEPR